jgi:nucleoside-diphosphate-sugar epimerase
VDVREIVLDISRIRAELGWRPGFTLEEGIWRTWKWLRES